MSNRRINAVDVHVGLRVRVGRHTRSMTQETLADAIGVSFQQIQKYENGMNRIGTGRLHAIATVLELPVTYFFEGLDNKPSCSGENSNIDMINEVLATKEGMRIALALARIRDPVTRHRIADLLEAMIMEESEEIQLISKV